MTAAGMSNVWTVVFAVGRRAGAWPFGQPNNCDDAEPHGDRRVYRVSNVFSHHAQSGCSTMRTTNTANAATRESFSRLAAVTVALRSESMT
jgi:hypothetical protein